MSEFKIHHERVYDEHLTPERTGAYVITHSHDKMHVEKYVGATKNIRKRMFWHSGNKNIIYVDVYLTNNLDIAQRLERILMKLIEPATNLVHLSLSDKDTEIMNELLKDDVIKECILENTIKVGCRYLSYVIADKLLHENHKHKPRPTTVLLDTEAYSLIYRKRYEIFKMKGNSIPIQKLVSESVKKGIDLIII